MMRRSFAVLACAACVRAADPLLAMMPRETDWTRMGWVGAFPGHTPGAPWRRAIETGRYTFVLDTDALAVPYFGITRDVRWTDLPAASLDLAIESGGQTYRCRGGGPWTRFGGPRLIESGRWLQRADVTGLKFASDAGEPLNVEARFETTAWPDRLALLFAARPGIQSIPAGEACFGRVGGGFGLDGSNQLEVAHTPALDPERFTIELWAFVPPDYQASPRTPPWLVCKNRHEQFDGNYGIVLQGGKAQGRLNIGGGRDNAVTLESDKPLRLDAWNHFAISYDGDTFRLHVNGDPAGAKKIGKPRRPGSDGLAFGRRQDNCGDGYHFRGVIDEIRLYNRALTDAEIRGRMTRPAEELQPVQRWSFRSDVASAQVRPRESWTNATMTLRFTSKAGTLEQSAPLVSNDWNSVAIVPLSGPGCDVDVRASEVATGTTRPVMLDPARGCQVINLDGVEPVVPAGEPRRFNDAIERVRLVLANTNRAEQVARLLFEKTAHGIRQRGGAPITGISAILLDTAGRPTGIPVQLSKNWHNEAGAGVYAGQWFHGLTQVRVPAGATVELELAIVYGHWGGVPAASHAQLCLIGWGSNQLWDQSALGSWGESICYEPDQAQAAASILDVRPAMVKSMSGDQPFNWTHNVGGGDWFRLFDSAGQRVFPAGIRTDCRRQGPCLTEVTYSGRLGDSAEEAVTASLARTDDLVRGTYRLRLAVRKPFDFSRFVFFQIGADTYSYTAERKMAHGDAGGLVREWPAQWGGNVYRTGPIACTGRVPWVSLHEGEKRAGERAAGSWANRGLVIREWKATLGGKASLPWIAERGIDLHGTRSSTVDLVPPPGVTRLLPGDSLEAVIEMIIVPQSATDYHGPNQDLRTALAQDGNTWRMIRREAAGNERSVQVAIGHLVRCHPDIEVKADDGVAAFTLHGGLAYVPVTISGLLSPRDFTLTVDGRAIDQSVHGRDWWQADYDASTERWSLTFNLPAAAAPQNVRFAQQR